VDYSRDQYSEGAVARPVSLEQVQRSLDPSAVILEYVVADPRSYCLVISKTDARIVALADKQSIEALIAAYLKAVKAKAPAHKEGRALYDELLAPISTAARKENLVVVRDGPLHLVPFDGSSIAEAGMLPRPITVIYRAVRNEFLLAHVAETSSYLICHALLAVGGVPYSPPS